MIKIINNKTYVILDEEREKSLHKEAFNDTYTAIKDFSRQSQEIYLHIKKNKPKEREKLFAHQVLCSPPGHGKTTALECHIKNEIVQTDTKKNPYLLVFNNNDTMNTFYEAVSQFANKYNFKNVILAINENNMEQFKDSMDYYQVVCIMQQRLRDLAIDFGDYSSFLWYRQENWTWGEKPKKVDRTFVQRTIIVDEMPLFFNSVMFDIGKENNALDWYDTFANNTSEAELSANEKQKGRLYISRLMNMELNTIGESTLKLMRSIVATSQESELLHILDTLNKNNADNESINRYRRFKRLLHEDDVGAINRTAKKVNILTSEFIDYKPFGNILVLDGTAHITHTVYDYAGFKINLIHNYHNYEERLKFLWNKINTSSRKRADPKSEIREQIAEDIIEKRKKGINILPIPSKGDKNTYIKLGAITSEQHKKFFMDRQSEDDSLAINIHNLTGKNDLSQYNHIALLNLPIMKPDEYKLQAIALYGTDVDLRLVKEIEDIEEQKLHKGKWFADDRLQNLFEEHQKAELFQIIHRSSIRNLNSSEKVVIHLYHNKDKVIEMLKEIFNLTDKNIITVDIQKKNKFKVKCRKWAEQISNHLKNNPNEEFTVFQTGGNNFKYWIKDNWNENENTIREIFREYKIAIRLKGKANYKYFSYVDNGIFEDLIDDEELEKLFA
ncbi:hypothetical protein P9E34_14255 [Schinkia azotoformans]|uniref:hypothetical protein n=1 Tax=Schinkia azotoformans TaxID=1454 RepID=UPI002DBF714A|nr:hypothetical protein [Schinkia azotoformans]MEC1725877.1 hypothetical protein [Schinkia azotoformans]